MFLFEAVLVVVIVVVVVHPETAPKFVSPSVSCDCSLSPNWDKIALGDNLHELDLFSIRCNNDCDMTKCG